MIEGNRTPRVTLLGNFSRGEAGKLSVLVSTIKQLTKISRRSILFEVSSDSPSFIRSYLGKDLDVIPFNSSLLTASLGYFGIPSLLSIKRSDLVIVVDESLRKKSWLNPFGNNLLGLFLISSYVKFRGKPLIFLNTEAGQFTPGIAKLLLKKLLESTDLIVCRDQVSRDNLHSLMLSKPVFCTANLAASKSEKTGRVGAEVLSALGIRQANQVLIALEAPNSNSSAALELITEAVVSLKLNRDFDTVLFSFQEKSYQIARNLSDRISNLYHEKSGRSWRPAIVSSRDHFPEQLRSVLVNFDLFAVTSTEALTFAMSAKRPVVTMPISDHFKDVAQVNDQQGLFLNLPIEDAAFLEKKIIEVLSNSELLSSHQVQERSHLIDKSHDAVELIVAKFFSSSGRELGLSKKLGNAPF